MTDWLTYAISAGCGVLLLWTLWHLVRDVRPGDPLALGLAVVELGLLAQLVVGIVQVAQGAGDGVNGVVFIGYLLGALVVLPAGLFWSLGEPTRSGTAVLVVALLVVPFLELRLTQIWAGGA